MIEPDLFSFSDKGLGKEAFSEYLIKINLAIFIKQIPSIAQGFNPGLVEKEKINRFNGFHQMLQEN